MSETGDKMFKPNEEFVRKAHIKSMEQYKEMYKESIENPDKFWSEIAENFTWFKKWTTVRQFDFVEGHIKFFDGGKTNVTYNCLDRHLEKNGDRIAYLWEGNEPGEDRKITYKELHEEVCKFANVLRKAGVKKGDRVCMYLQMIPELPVAMLACARIGAVHSVVFGAFSADSLKDRIQDSTCKVLITQDTALRGKKKDVPMKTNADRALDSCPSIEKTFVVKRTGEEVPMKDGRDVWWHDEMGADDVKGESPIEHMDAEDPLFILYTSGSTGKPKGVLHSTGGYMVYTSITHKYVFDYHHGDIWWCTADIGWVTGHSYIVYGPLLNGATSVMFEGVPTYPNASRFWEVVDKYKVTQFYTAPTAIRALMKEGDEPVTRTSRKSLKLLGTVGEPINPEAWNWYNDVVGEGRCPIVDTWWQTETGGVLITPLPGATPTKPGSATLPFFGVEPAIVDEKGNELQGPASGALLLKGAWPGIMRTVYGHHQRFKEVYFSMFPGNYFTGDGAKRDEDGYYWITGRIDDVINVSGHRMGTAEVESALVSHPAVAEAAVVGFPHDIKGQGIYAYVTLKNGYDYTDDLKKELQKHVRNEIGPIAQPDIVQWAPGLPKTRSGKIMRRILRKIAAKEMDQVGDISTLADPSVVENLIKMR
ncbi:MAG: acetate--CoA ligase [Candidatus Thermoplasmatota archaeon]|nr:acetate--CoA ligase [Euryarchaeota archaeon]MBU4032184.1 acetate--CoA ligase [Candidatus Thermoplasmatota archaeon]MBU4071448.1 acetate--CoA ligase [Candidatus Thermoplasmatota archaeon]MBU4144400.1 acetate--CoA ligase [Candidatus Thermoplasmatota archaeon]MBU4591563.1 acetate--CoA ligase [Candidatus Thermoplasmatota archaeon]